ncbi:MAG: hypothetical protein QOK40_2231 [Miltoncostaeaceae bacterium]|nr:hypothetical protein [Miltoncostaeaceae bacterium]
MAVGAPQLASNLHGLDVVAWRELPDGRFAERVPGALAFGPSEPTPAPTPPLVGLDAAGTALLSWATSFYAGPAVLIQAASRSAGGPWSAAETLASSQALSTSSVSTVRLEVSPSGTALLVWQAGQSHYLHRGPAGQWSEISLSGTQSALAPTAPVTSWRSPRDRFPSR